MTDEVILTPESDPAESKPEPLDLEQTNGQIESRIYHYRVNNDILISVIAPNATSAKAGIAQRFPNMSISYRGMSDKIIQVN